MKKITVFSVANLLESSEKGCRGASVWGLLQKPGETWSSGPEGVVVGERWTDSGDAEENRTLPNPFSLILTDR